MSAKNSNVESKPVKCKLDADECISLLDILISFNSPISEEHAWALCFECAKCFKNAYSRNRDKCRLVKKLDQVLLHRDGYVHAKSILTEDKPHNSIQDRDIVSRKRKPTLSEKKLLAGLGYVIFQALDFSIDEDEERAVTPQLEWLLNFMIQKDNAEVERTYPETDDEGIEKDSGECDDDTRKPDDQSLNRVLEICKDHVGAPETDEADSHYRAVCRALVAEVQELSSFLQKVSESSNDLYLKADTLASSEALDCLNFQDWARLWIQVIRELRHGVKLKKVVFSRTPVEYELTPYEILMEDIRSRRYKLNKVMIDGTIPAPVKKDAHAIILEFIRSRPPLKKASERQLPPPKRAQSTPRERLLESIKQGNVKLKKCITSTPRRLVPYADNKNSNKNSENNNCFSQRQGSTRRLIKVDYSVIQNTDDDDDDDDESGDVHDNNDKSVDETYEEEKKKVDIGSDLSTRIAVQNAMFRTAYDLATQCPSRKSTRRHTMVCILPSGSAAESNMMLKSRHAGQNGDASFARNENSATYALPQRSWSRSSLQEELFESKQWQDECLSLTLEEIVHIRSVLTKAELESLPVEGQVKEDVEKRKVCFLCLKTRFSLFGPWGQICRLCKRTVCNKCSSKMRIPTEHFSHVPVVALSPTMSPVEQENSMASTILSRLNGGDGDRGKGGVGSAPTSPKISRVCASPSLSERKLSVNSHEGSISEPQSLVRDTSQHNIRTEAKATTNGNAEHKSKITKLKAEKLKGIEMIVCMDCKTMVIQIIKSSRTKNKPDILHKLTLDLTPIY